MAELTFKSAGVSTREIDLSQPSTSAPSGVPAGIIGTSLEGPAFVPLTLGSYSDFTALFGKSDGSKFGPIAVNEWLRNAGSATFIRILGIGDGKQRNTQTGIVNNAGFKVGDRLVQPDGLLANNPYANSGVGAVKGRTYFLGCFMSESNGSTYFSDAGLVGNGGLHVTASIPVLRGVLLAPSGVILHLSGNNGANNAGMPSSTQTAASADGVIFGRKGSLTGSVDLRSGKEEIVILLNGHKGTSDHPTHLTASFDPLASNYLSRVLNTDPLNIEKAGHLLYAHYPIHGNIATITGSGVTTEGHMSKGLGSTYDASILKEDIAFLLTSSLGREADTNGIVPDYEDFQDRYTHAETPYVISQKFGNKKYNLFKVVALSAGSGVCEKFKFSIENLVRSTSTSYKFGTFDFIIRRGSDNDDEPVVLESFRGCDLDPESVNFIGRRVGDQNAMFDFDTALDSQKIVVKGTHPVLSRYVRLELSDDLKAGNVPDEALPMGHRGIYHLITSGSSLLSDESDSLYTVSNLFTMLNEPPLPYRNNIHVGTGLNKRVNSNFYWGVQSTLKINATQENLVTTNDALIEMQPVQKSFQVFFPKHRINTNKFYAGENAGKADANGIVFDSDRFNNNIFTLENIKVRTGSDSDGTITSADPEYWVSASYVRNGIISIDDTAKTRAFKVNDLDIIGNRKFVKFTFFAQGGHDGVNIFNREKRDLTNNAIKYENDDSNQGGINGPTVAAYRKAIDIMGSKSDVDIQLLTIPGARHSIVSDYAITAVENRFDCLYLMDLEERDQVNSVVTSSVQNVSVKNTVSSFKNRNLNTSFAATYFPDVTITDPDSGTLISVPPSVVALGVYGLNDSTAAPWVAPAGKTRGVVSNAAAVNVLFNRNNLDELYDADINPITSFPGSGIVVYGQKTLLSNNSALDRVNVRRLLISVRRAVRNVANTLLFEPNRASTLARFTALVNPILQNVKDRNGISRYKVIIDSSTTTQIDIENNTIRGKIYLQPVRSIEFISLDFVVTNSGAEI